jgi:hypothetical protein
MPANYVLLEVITLTQSTASVTFDNIPQTGYSGLKVVMSARTTTNSFPDVYTQFNLDTAANYNWRVIYGTGASAGYNTASNTTSIAFGTMVGSSETSNTFTNSELSIPNYTGSTKKTVLVDAVTETNGSTAYSSLLSGLWTGTAAITSIKLSTSATAFAQNSTFSLYGLAATGSSPSFGAKATGGNIIETDGTYWYHTFLSSGVLIAKTSFSCDYLVIAGGGGGAGVYSGGNYSAPGGGAGGYRTSAGTSGGGASAESQLSLTAGSYPVVIGAGSPSGNFSGSDSILGSITSVGGGGTPGKTGGSGGGAFDFAPQNTAGAGTAGQGYAGALAASATSAGGGGGAGSVGSIARTGGSGVASSITGTSVTRAGGGGAGWGGTATAGGGAGAAANATGSGTAGTANTGGGGGGGAAANGFGAGGAGGSGLVVIRYAV